MATYQIPLQCQFSPNFSGWFQCRVRLFGGREAFIRCNHRAAHFGSSPSRLNHGIEMMTLKHNQETIMLAFVHNVRTKSSTLAGKDRENSTSNAGSEGIFEESEFIVSFPDISSDGESSFDPWKLPMRYRINEKEELNAIVRFVGMESKMETVEERPTSTREDPGTPRIQQKSQWHISVWRVDWKGRYGRSSSVPRRKGGRACTRTKHTGNRKLPRFRNKGDRFWWPLLWALKSESDPKLFHVEINPHYPGISQRFVSRSKYFPTNLNFD